MSGYLDVHQSMGQYSGAEAPDSGKVLGSAALTGDFTLYVPNILDCLPLDANNDPDLSSEVLDIVLEVVITHELYHVSTTGTGLSGGGITGTTNAGDCDHYSLQHWSADLLCAELAEASGGLTEPEQESLRELAAGLRRAAEDMSISKQECVSTNGVGSPAPPDWAIPDHPPEHC